MVLALDSSAALSLFPGYGRQDIASAVGGADELVVSALCRPEVTVALQSQSPAEDSMRLLAAKIGDLWERFWVIPVDSQCLDLATEIAGSYRLPLPHAIHLAAFDRIERPVRFATLDGRQIPAAVDLGFDLEVEPSGGGRSAHDMLRSPQAPLRN